MSSLLVLLLLAGILLAYYCESLALPHLPSLRPSCFPSPSLSAFPVSSACVHGVQCGDGSCVWESQWCDGVHHCPAGQDEANCGSSLLFLSSSASVMSPPLGRDQVKPESYDQTQMLLSIPDMANSLNMFKRL